MKSIIVFDGFKIIAAIVALIAGMMLLLVFFADRYFRNHPHSRFKKIVYRIMGVPKDLW